MADLLGRPGFWLTLRRWVCCCGATSTNIAISSGTVSWNAMKLTGGLWWGGKKDPWRRDRLLCFHWYITFTCSIRRLIDWLIDWLTAWCMVRLIDWLIDFSPRFIPPDLPGLDGLQCLVGGAHCGDFQDVRVHTQWRGVLGHEHFGVCDCGDGGNFRIHLSSTESATDGLAESLSEIYAIPRFARDYWFGGVFDDSLHGGTCSSDSRVNFL